MKWNEVKAKWNERNTPLGVFRSVTPGTHQAEKGAIPLRVWLRSVNGVSRGQGAICASARRHASVRAQAAGMSIQTTCALHGRRGRLCGASALIDDGFIAQAEIAS